MAENREDQQAQTSAQTSVSAPVQEDELDLGFTGKYTHGLDSKGRLIVPAAFRSSLGARFAVCPSPDFRNIAIYPIRAWVERRNDYVALCRKDASIRRILDMYTKYSFVDSEMDAQGRLLLPFSLRQKMLGDAKEVDINGSYDHIIVQDSREGEAEDVRFREDFPDVYAFVASIQKQ